MTNKGSTWLTESDISDYMNIYEPVAQWSGLAYSGNIFGIYFFQQAKLCFSEKLSLAFFGPNLI